MSGTAHYGSLSNLALNGTKIWEIDPGISLMTNKPNFAYFTMCCDTLLGLICNAAKSHLKKGPDLETLANSLGIYRNSHGMFQEKFMRPLKFLSAKLQYVFRSPVSDELLPKLKQKVFVA